AMPLVSVALPNVLAPSRKMTVPVGVPDPGASAATVAVKVTAWPNTDGLAEEITVLVLLTWLTVWVMAADMLLPKLVSPPYTAVIGWAPTGKLTVVNVARPMALSVPVPRLMALSRKVTVPVGVPVAGATA